jgi:hypothetical protein
MGSNLDKTRKTPFGGEILLNFYTNSKDLPQFQLLLMELLVSSGMIFGMA